MKGFPTREQVAQIKEKYPIGTTIKLISMDDPYAPIAAGTEGEIVSIDDCGTFLMKWDNGRTLGLVPFEDRFEVLSRPEEQEEMQTMETGGMSL